MPGNNELSRALVFLRVDSRIENMVIDEIKTLTGVKEAHYIYGPYDMYVEVEVKDINQLQNLVLDKIRNLYGIISTTTCYVVE